MPSHCAGVSDPTRIAVCGPQVDTRSARWSGERCTPRFAVTFVAEFGDPEVAPVCGNVYATVDPVTGMATSSHTVPSWTTTGCVPDTDPRSAPPFCGCSSYISTVTVRVVSAPLSRPFTRTYRLSRYLTFNTASTFACASHRIHSRDT